MRAIVALCVCVLGLGWAVPSFGADGLPGKYSDGNLTVEWAAAADAYAGTFSLGGRSFPATAHVSGQSIEGSFTSGSSSFPFTATLDGDTLTLVTGGKTYTTKRLIEAANPLADGAQANPAAAAAPAAAQPAVAAADIPVGYVLLNATDAGKSICTTKPNATSVQNAMEATLPDLAKVFDGRPVVTGAFVDNRDHKSGAASFTDKLHGQAMNGFISCKMADKGANIAVIYCRTDAPRAEWDKLSTAAPGAQPAGDAATAGPAAAAGTFNLHENTFPDNTASFGLADGWTTKSQTGMSPVVFTGPDSEVVEIGLGAAVMTPDAPLVQMYKQNAANAKKMGMAAPQPPQFLVSPIVSPVEALKLIVKFQAKQQAKKSGGTVCAIDKIISNEPAKGSMPNSTAATLYYTYTSTTNGVTRHMRAHIFAMVSPTTDTMWSLSSNGVTGPDETFDRDQPLMLAMLMSYKENGPVIMQIGAQQRQASAEQNQQIMNQRAQQAQAWQQQMNANHAQAMADQQQRFEDGQAAHQAQLDGYAQHNASVAYDEQVRQRQSANFTEMIGGYRDVLDTNTGLKTKVDLYDVNAIVAAGNAQDPGRFVQIPLRDELYPLPGQPAQ